MKRSMNKTKFSKLRQVILIGLALLVAGLAVLLVLSPDVVMADKPDKPGKPDKPPGKGEPGLYRVYMSTSPGEMGIDTDLGCNDYGYVLAEWDGKSLHANGTFLDPTNNETIPLLMQLSADGVTWERKYDAGTGKGLFGTFNGCYGETAYYHGALFIMIAKVKRKPIIRFTWYFDYYTATDPDVREHFAFFSEDIPFPAWTGENIERQVQGWFDLQYYLNDPDNRPSYVSLTNDEGRTLNIYLKIEKVTQ